MKTVAVDFDGVIHAYSRGWRDGSIYDPPIEGAVDGLRALQREYSVFIFSSRSADQIVKWLRALGVDAVTDDEANFPKFWDSRDVVLVTKRKLAACAYLDDRAVRFTSWPAALNAVQRAVEESPAQRVVSLPSGGRVIADVDLPDDEVNRA